MHPISQKILVRFAHKLLGEIKQDMIHNGQYVTADAYDSFGVEARDDGVYITCTDRAVYHLDQGRKPGGKLPPKHEIVRWLQIKKGMSEEDAYDTSYVIQRKIAEDGTPPTFVVGNVVRRYRA